jgi:integrase/recombinase XerD
MKHNDRNERLKRAYVRYLKDACRQGAATIDAALAAIERFEVYTNRRDFAAFHIEHASAFKDHLAGQLNGRTKKPLSVQTQLHTLAALRSFFIWLADQPGFRRRIRHSDADYFSLSLKQTAIAQAAREIEGPTIEQVRHAIELMPARTDIEKRNRALIAFATLTGARDDALASLRLKHVDVAQRRVLHDAREVRTKASKTIETWFLRSRPLAWV